jgi:Mrp family chromosome partitioning ATPase
VLVVAPDADPAEVVRSYLVAHTGLDATSEEGSAPAQRIVLGCRSVQLRLGVYGSRGGVGVTSAAVTAARLLADRGHRVALYDAAGRGDAALLLGLTPSEQPVSAGRITVYSGLPETDEAPATCDALIVDGGRERRPVAARWILLDKPPAESEVVRRLGLIDAPPEGLSQ